MNTKTEKANPDYSKTAVKLCNPLLVLDLLILYQEAINTLDATKAKIPEDIMNECIKAEDRVKGLHDEIKQAIEQHGSYQDIDVGVYGVKYAKHSKEYHVEPFKQYYPKEVPVVVQESINVEALKGLIKGKLLDEETLERQKVITETESFAFYIR